MIYETLYESGRSPFRPDITRGSWATPEDFIYASLGLAFKLDFMFLSWRHFEQIGFAACIPYSICLALYVVPTMVVQSFMGQFSSSGFISAFRLAPINKSIGYISIIFHIITLTYYSVFVAIPLFFFVHSFYPTVPWSCEVPNYATLNTSRYTDKNICRITQHTDVEAADLGFPYFRKDYHMPAELFIGSQFNTTYLTSDYTRANTISWQLAGFTLLTWFIIAWIINYLFNTEKFGKFLRYAVCGTLLALAICLMRFLFLSGAVKGLMTFFIPKPSDMAKSVFGISLQVMSALGPGWGTLVTLASFNKFKTNIIHYSWVIALGQMLIFLAFGLLSCLLDNHLTDVVNEYEKHEYGYVVLVEWRLIIYGAQAISTLELPHMWYILYYGMLSAAGLIVLLIQIHSLLTSVFDEFVILRAHKTKVTHGLIATLALCSLYFCTGDGFFNFNALSMDSVIFQILLNILLLIVVLWIYGSVRFKRDIEFMLSQPFSSLKVDILRFGAPLILLVILLKSFPASIYEHMNNVKVIHGAAIFCFVLPLLFLPVYCIFSLVQTTGSCWLRFKRCCRPTDWYPMDMDDRQRYEEAMGNFEITHQLQEVQPEMETELF